MPRFDCGITGLAGTIGCTIYDEAGAVHVARATAGISEKGYGSYFIAEHDASATLTYEWDTGVGTPTASETLYAGRGNLVNADVATSSRLADADYVAPDDTTVLAAIAAIPPTDISSLPTLSDIEASAVLSHHPTGWAGVTEATLDSGGVALGICVDDHGDPVPNTRIVGYLSTDVDHSAPANATNSAIDGTFSLLLPPDATYSIVFTDPGNVPQAKEVIV